MWLRARHDKNAGGDARAPMSGIEVIGWSRVHPMDDFHGETIERDADG